MKNKHKTVKIEINSITVSKIKCKIDQKHHKYIKNSGFALYRNDVALYRNDVAAESLETDMTGSRRQLSRRQVSLVSVCIKPGKH